MAINKGMVEIMAHSKATVNRDTVRVMVKATVVVFTVAVILIPMAVKDKLAVAVTAVAMVLV